MFKETNGAFSRGIITSINTGVHTNGPADSDKQTNKKCSSALIGQLYRKLKLVRHSRGDYSPRNENLVVTCALLQTGESGDVSLPKF